MAEEIRDFSTEYKWWENLEKKTKLEQAFAIGCTDKEACAYAEITEDQLYYYENTINTQFRVKKHELKEKPILKARQTVVKALDNPKDAQWYLEKKLSDEFGVTTKSVNYNATVTGDIKDFEKYQELKQKYEQELLNTLQNES